MQKFNWMFEKSRKSIMTTNILLTMGIAVIELIIYLVFIKEGNINIQRELLMSFVVPTSVNIMICLLGHLLLQFTGISESVKNYIPIYVLTLLCFNIVIEHSSFQASLSSFCIPILMTILYANKKMTRIVFISCLVLQQLAIYLSSISSNKEYVHIIIDVIASAFILLASYAFAIVLIQYEYEKKEMFSKSIVRQIELQELLMTDPLTSLNNLRAFRGAMEELVEQAENNKKEVILAVIDIDNFKQINDVYGHEEGNVVLAKLGRLLRRYSGQEGIAARYGGEEFAVLFHDIDVKEAVKRMQKVLTKFSESGFPRLGGKKVTFSCGVVMYKSGQTSQEFFIRADKAMYNAKRQGKNNVRFEGESYAEQNKS